jgi:hypothetical protein
MNNLGPVNTLEQFLSAGSLPPGEALRIALAVAEQLRQFHDYGSVHGALTPAAIGMDGRVQLQPPSATFAAPPYAAPEVLQGKPADARSDIYSLGAILYEMFTGRTFNTVVVSGDPALDRVVANCVAASPDARYQRVQKLQLELKLLMATMRRGMPASAPAPILAPAPVPAPTPILAALPAPIMLPPPSPVPLPDNGFAGPLQELEARMAHRFAEQDRAVASVERVAQEVLKALRAQVPAPAPPPALYSRPAARLFPDSFEGDPGHRVEQALEMLNDKIARAVEHIQQLGEKLEAFDTDAAALRDSVTRDIRNFERLLKQQSAAVESARTAMGQTDDLVERVVEALDSLQSMFVTAPEHPAVLAG